MMSFMHCQVSECVGSDGDSLLVDGTVKLAKLTSSAKNVLVSHTAQNFPCVKINTMTIVMLLELNWSL